MRNLTLPILVVLNALLLLSGESWAQWTQVESYNHYTQPIVIVGKNVFVGFTGFNGTHAGVFRSTDNGDTWSAIDSGLVKNGDDTLNVQCLAAMGDTIIAGTDSDGIFISTNNGDSWQQSNNGIADSSNQILDITAIGIHNLKIYADGSSGLGVFVSSNWGQSWDSIDAGLPHSYFGYPVVNAKEFYFVGQYIYIVCPYGGTFVSTDEGANWTNIFGDTASFGGNCFVSMGDIIFLGRNFSDGYPLYTLLRSTINGKSWTDISESFDKIDKGSSIHALAAYKNNLLVGSDHGVYISSDSGTTWVSFNLGWDYKFIQVNSLALNNNYIFACTNSEGIWRIPLSQIVTSVKKPKETIPVNYSLSQNYPNPFNPSTAISYQLSSFSYVILQVYDILGRKVETLVNKNEPPGKYKINFNGSNLSSGVYFYKLKVVPIEVQSGRYIQTRKMVLIK